MEKKPTILEFFLTKAPKIAKAAKVVAQVLKDVRIDPPMKVLPRKKPAERDGTVIKMAFLTIQENTTIKEIDEKLKDFYTSESLPFFEIYDREIFASHVQGSYHVCMYFDVLVKMEKKAALAEMRSRATELVQKSTEVLGFWVKA